LGGAYVISFSHMAIEKIECVYYTKPTYLYNLEFEKKHKKYGIKF
jgi:hypothetical protein